MKSRRYAVVDVFTEQPLLGNPVAVVLDADGLDTTAMQAIANWTNLSETTFVLPPTNDEADYQLRIFTPRSELAFAGHPTLGSAHAILEHGLIRPKEHGRFIQQSPIGLVDVSIGEAQSRRITLRLPPATTRALEQADIAELELIFGCKGRIVTPPLVVNVGAVWTVLHLPDAASVLALQPDLARLAEFERRLGVTGVTAFGSHTSGDIAIEVRTFAPSCGVNEDPVCGSGNGSVAVFRWVNGLMPALGLDYVAAQGQRVGRDGRVHVSIGADGTVRLGGSCVTCVLGTLSV
jgi:PhzF family phenazine biosynthesis protein